MDIGYDTIIYIILGLVFVFVQVAKNKKKAERAKAAENQGDNAGQPRLGRSILEQLLDLPEEKPIVEKPVENNTSFHDDFGPSFSQPGPGESVIGPDNEEVTQMQRSGYVKPPRKLKSKTARRPYFNLKQAVIYKAILERKKF